MRTPDKQLKTLIIPEGLATTETPDKALSEGTTADSEASWSCERGCPTCSVKLLASEARKARTTKKCVCVRVMFLATMVMFPMFLSSLR